MKQEAVVAGLESLIQDKRQSYRLGAFATGKATRSLSGITRSVLKGRGMDFVLESVLNIFHQLA